MNKLQIISEIFPPEFFTPVLIVSGERETLIAQGKARYCTTWSASILIYWEEKCNEHGYTLNVDLINQRFYLIKYK